MGEGPSDERDQRALDLVIAEFQFVSGLIPFYRGVETTALGGTGLVVSGIVAALAALESSDSPNRAAEGILLSAGAWAPVLLLMIELMALTRLRRASVYIADRLRALAQDLTGREEVLHWEVEPSEHLVAALKRPSVKPASRRAVIRWARRRLLSKRVVTTWLSSTPLIATIALVSIVLAVSGAFVYPSMATLVSAVLASGCAIGGAAFGTVLSAAIEHRTAEASSDPSD